MTWADESTTQPLFHGTRADLKSGDLIVPGRRSNFGSRKIAGFVYVTTTLDAAAWGAELAQGEQSGRIYTVEPTGPIEADPNLTRDGTNPTGSYRSVDPVRVTGEIAEWEGHPPELINSMKERIKGLDPLPGS